jgi:hypothetical protein
MTQFKADEVVLSIYQGVCPPVAVVYVDDKVRIVIGEQRLDDDDCGRFLEALLTAMDKRDEWREQLQESKDIGYHEIESQPGYLFTWAPNDSPTTATEP